MSEVAPEILINEVYAKIADVLLNGDGDVMPKSNDHYLAFLSPGIPYSTDAFLYASEGFGGVARPAADDAPPLDAVDEESMNSSSEEEDGEGSTGLSVAQDARKKYAAAESFSALCDLVPDVDNLSSINANRINTWQPETSVTHSYGMALQFSQVVASEPDKETKQNLERWRGLLETTRTEKDLVDPSVEREVIEQSPLMRRYNDTMLKYYAERQAYNTMRIEALTGQEERAVHEFAINGSLMQLKVNAAEDQWVSLGRRDDVQRVVSAIQSVEGRSFTLLKQQYLRDFNRSLLTSPNSGANFQYMAPAVPYFASGDVGWSTFSFNSESYKSGYAKSRRETAFKSGFKLFSVDIGSKGKLSKETINRKVDTEHFKMSFEWARVPIYRPGINLSFLTSGFWRFEKSNPLVKNSMISTGQVPPAGLLPAITTDCIFVRNLEIQFGDRSSELTKSLQDGSFKGGVSLGTLDLGLGGKHSFKKSTRASQSVWEGQKLKVDGMQLMGFFCWMLPESPNPHPDIKSWI